VTAESLNLSERILRVGVPPGTGQPPRFWRVDLAIPWRYEYHTFMESNGAPFVLPRAAAAPLRRALTVAPVVVLTGARQTGKSTLIRWLPELRGRSYLTLDDLAIREQAQTDPETLLERAPELVLDEVQRAKDLLIAVKRAVDRDRPRRPGRFVLTGSANLLMMRQLGETLAGRAAFVTLWPFTQGELRGEGRTGTWAELLSTPFRDWRDLIASSMRRRVSWREAVSRGSYPVPALHLRDAEQRTVWLSGYERTYLERDLPTLRAVENLADFRRLMKALALRTGNLLNQSELGRDVGISQPQVHRFLSVLEASFLVVRLPAYSVNRTKRLLKMPKVFWCDPALALHLAGEDEPRGAHLENLVLLDLLAWREVEPRRPEILHWRTASGQEVDLVIEWNGRLLPLEVKAGKSPVPRDARHLEAFLDEYPDQTPGALLLHAGNETFPLTPRVLATPWWSV